MSNIHKPPKPQFIPPNVGTYRKGPAWVSTRVHVLSDGLSHIHSYLT